MVKWLILIGAGIIVLYILKKFGLILLSLAMAAVILYAAYNITMDTQSKIHYVTPFQTIFQ